MGGFGAAHLGFKYPDLFGVVSIVAGALHDAQTIEKLTPEAFKKVFGGDAERFTAESPLTLGEKNADRIRGRTRIRIVSGQRDRLLKWSTALHEKLDSLDIDHGMVVVLAAGHTHEKIYAETTDLTAEFYRKAFASK